MTRSHGFGVSRRDEQADHDRQTKSLAALAVVLALVVAGLFVIDTLRAEDHLEDCLLAGRTDCNLALSHHQLPHAW